MGDSKDDVRYPLNLYGENHQQGYGSSHGQKLGVRSATYSQSVGNLYADDEEEEGDYEEDLGEEDGDDDDDQNNGVQMVKAVDGDYDDSDGSNDGDHRDKPKEYGVKIEDVDLVRHQKKRKLKSLISSYEFAPRVPVPPPTSTPPPKPSSGGCNSLTDWTERETFVLLDAWGDRFLRRGRKSLRFEEWREVTDKVSEVSKIARTDTQCRNRLDTLKKKYKKEKAKFAEKGVSASKWVCFKKMDMLMSSPPQQTGLSCGLDSGAYIFVSPRVYLNPANGLDEVRDSPDDSEYTQGDNDSDELPPKKRKLGRDNDNENGSSVCLLADSIYKFSEIYEKVESSKMQQMMEREKMRMDFHRDLEMQTRQTMERAQAEIAKMLQGHKEENENASG